MEQKITWLRHDSIQLSPFLLLWRNYLKSFIVLLLGLSFTHCDSKEALAYTILKGENQQNEQLILLLHGMNSNTAIWDDFAQYIDDKTLLIAVEAPFKTSENSFRWYDIDLTQNTFVSDLKQMTTTSNQLKSLLHQLKHEHNLKTEDIVLVGFSQGAILSLNMALTQPETISRIGVFSGMLPDEIDDRMAKEVKDLAVFIAHGTEDKGIDLSFAKEVQSFLKRKNIQVKMTTEKSGHTITTQQFQDFILWTKKTE